MAIKHVNSKIDWFIICKVKEMRVKRGLTQPDIAFYLQVSKGFIGHVESPKFRAKYNTTHLNELAKLFNRSPKDFMPDKPF
jgi:transcriptional regulator with XRE-family HTH domain